jgi:hypothetical protein
LRGERAILVRVMCVGESLVSLVGNYDGTSDDVAATHFAQDLRHFIQTMAVQVDW